MPSRVTGLISIWEIQDRLGLINSTWGLILPYQTLALAVSIFIMRGVFETIPKELAESARVDGASSFMILRRIMLPLVRNGVIVVLITNFIAAWGEWLLANTLTNDQEKRHADGGDRVRERRLRPVAVADDGGDVRRRDPARA